MLCFIHIFLFSKCTYYIAISFEIVDDTLNPINQYRGGTILTDWSLIIKLALTGWLCVFASHLKWKATSMMSKVHQLRRETDEKLTFFKWEVRRGLPRSLPTSWINCPSNSGKKDTRCNTFFKFRDEKRGWPAKESPTRVTDHLKKGVFKKGAIATTLQYYHNHWLYLVIGDGPTTTTPRPLTFIAPHKQIRPKLVGPCFHYGGFDHLVATCPCKDSILLSNLL